MLLKCIFKKVDKDDKVSLKEVVIKKLNRLVKEKEVRLKPRTEEKVKESQKELLAKELIEKLNEKYGDNFDNIDNNEISTQSIGTLKNEQNFLKYIQKLFQEVMAEEVVEKK